MNDVSLKFIKNNMIYNLKQYSTKPCVILQQINCTKYSFNQNQKLLKFLIEKVDQIQDMIVLIEYKHDQPSFGSNTNKLYQRKLKIK